MQSVNIHYYKDGDTSQMLSTIKMSRRFFDFIQSMGGHEERGKITNAFYKIVNYDYKTFERLNFSKKGLLLFDYIDIRNEDSGLISYIPEGKVQQFSDDGKWTREGRQTIKIGKFIKKFIKQDLLDYFNITDVTLESLSKVSALFGNQKNIKIEVLSSLEDIQNAYYEGNYLDDDSGEVYPGSNASSSTHGSCMKYDKCSEWFKCYGEEDKIGMVVMTDIPSGKVLARAILWKEINADVDGSISTISLMDRVYALREWMIDVMLDWATDNGHYRKEYQAMGNKMELITPDGARVYAQLSYTFKEQYRYWPYFDTMSYLKTSDLTTVNNHTHYNYVELDHYQDGNTGIWDNHDGMIWIGGMGEWVDEDYVRYVNGRPYHDNDVSYVESRGDYFLNENVVFIESEGEYYHMDDFVDCNMIDGRTERVLEDDCEQSELNGEYYESGHPELTKESEPLKEEEHV